MFPKLFQSDSVRRPLGFQLDSQRPLASFLSKKNVRQRIFICNFAIFLPNLWWSLKKIKVFTLNRSCIEYFGKHCCKITYKRSLIVLHVYFFSLFPIAPLFSYRPLTVPFLLTALLNLANASWGAVAPTLGTTAFYQCNVSLLKYL